MTTKHPCPCCGYRTLTREPPGTCDVCPVCGWEDDDAQFRHPELEGGANAVSLTVARGNFADFGAASESARVHVRAPRADERP